ncbi:MAG: class I SAM-dependent methyltransferase [Ruminococcus sp.]|nr:class I SAM-dependent methyltransferase [Ruminococcus sp.]
MNQNWNAEKYSSDFSFVHNYGNDLIGLIDTANVNTVLDLGCGNGVLTNSLAEKGFSVIGIDGSKEMIKIARSHYPNIKFICSDATDFVLEKPVDAVFSNAVFHWIDKSSQSCMLKCVYQSLNSNGQFVFEMGGIGNNKLIHSALSNAFAEAGYEYTMPFYFPSIGEYSALLEKEGFKVRYAVLFDRPTMLKGDNGLLEWIHMFVNNPFLSVNPNDKKIIIDKVIKSLYSDLYRNGIWYADYVRLRMKAVKE